MGAVASAQEAVKKVSRNEAVGAAVTKVQPAYPPLARQFRVEGIVELDVVISESGAVEKVAILSGNAMLTHPAAEAAKQWKFTPFTHEGKPVKVETTLSFSFKM